MRDDSPTLQRATPGYSPAVLDKITGAYVVLGRGFALGWRWPHPLRLVEHSALLGHAGGFSVVAYADRTASSGIAIVTNGDRSVGDLVRRFAPLGSGIGRTLKCFFGRG